MFQFKHFILSPLAFLVTCLTSCSDKRPIQAGSTNRTLGLMDSLDLFSHQNHQEHIFGRFPRHHASLDTLACNYGLDLIWWKGEGSAPSIVLNWNHGGPRNLQDLNGHALRFDIRKKRQTGTSPVLVMGWRDQGGHAASIHLNQSHILLPSLDTAWQAVSVPLSDFSRGRLSTDFTRIEALELSLEHFGEVLIDNLRIGPHERNRKIERKAKKESLTECPEGKYNLFEEQFDHVWGLGNFGKRRMMVVSKKRGRNKSNALELEWDFVAKPFSKKGPRHNDKSIGFTWNGWNPVSIPQNLNGSEIQFHLKNIGVNPGPSGDLPLEVGIVDHQGETSKLSLTGDHFDNLRFGHWQTCSIPLSEFNWKKEKRDISGVSSIAFVTLTAKSNGHVFLDDISITFSN